MYSAKLVTIFLCFFTSTILPKKDIQRKIISDSEYNYSFYIITKNTSRTKALKYYHWFRSGEIHVSLGGSSGDLLHGSFTKNYSNHDIAEQGTFIKGLKDNVWRRWYKNGRLAESSHWRKGVKNGKFIEFSEDGKIRVEGNYKNNRKDGLWINRVSSDTLYYKNGELKELPKLIKKPLKKRIKEWYRKVFPKKDKDDLLLNKKIKKPRVKQPRRKK